MNDNISVPDYDRVWTHVYGDIQHFGPVHSHMRRIVSQILQGLDYQSVLDVGSGPGEHYALLNKGRSLSRYGGIDISALAIQNAQKLIEEGQFWQINIQQEHINGLWDLVYCSLLLEHVPDDVSALHHMRAMTGKYLLATTIAGDFERYKSWEKQLGHIRNYRVGELEEKLEKIGFTIQKAIYWGFPFYSPFARALHNRMKAKSKFGSTTRFIAKIMYYLYFLNSYKHGDLLIVLATV